MYIKGQSHLAQNHLPGNLVGSPLEAFQHKIFPRIRKRLIPINLIAFEIRLMRSDELSGPYKLDIGFSIIGNDNALAGSVSDIFSTCGP
jgi:hypothetical protein